MIDKLKLSRSFHIAFVNGSIGYLLILLAGALAGFDMKDTDEALFETKPKAQEERVVVSSLEKKPAGNPMVVLASHQEDTLSLAMANELEISLTYANLPFHHFDLHTQPFRDLLQRENTTLVITTSMLDDVSDESITRLLNYINRGGHVIFTRPVYNERLHYLQGIRPYTLATTDSLSAGWEFQTAVLPGFEGPDRQLFTEDVHGGIALESFMEKEIRILASAVNSNYPIIIEREIGAGSLFLYNSQQVTASPTFRGLIFSNIIKTLPVTPYEVANVSTIFLDDFPAATYNVNLEPIQEEYGLTMAEYINFVWWPDMKALADSLDITYTAMLTFNYNAVVEPPNDFEEWNAGIVRVDGRNIQVSDLLTRDVLRSRHELGFHGYNHISMLYNEWENYSYMQNALEAARKMWRIQQYGPLPVTYVPPHNLIDSGAFVELREQFPSIQTVSTTMQGQQETGGNREFGPDPYDPTLFNYPRVSDGFYFNNDRFFTQISLLMNTGLWNHFVHPDDVYDTPDSDGAFEAFQPRNPESLGWRKGNEDQKGLFYQFQERLQTTRQLFPLLRFKSAKSATSHVKNYLKRDYRRTFQQGMQIVDASGNDQMESRNSLTNFSPAYWFMYIPESLDSFYEQQMNQTSDEFAKTAVWDGYLYMFSTSSDSLMLPIIDDPNKRLPLSANRLQENRMRWQSIRNLTVGSGLEYTTAFMDSLVYRYRQTQNTDELDAIIRVGAGIDRLEQITRLLEDRWLQQRTLEPINVERLMIFYGWLEITPELWELLERRWQAFPDASTSELKNEAVQRYGWPDPETRLLWQRRDYELFPDSMSVARDLIFSLSSDSTSWDEAKPLLDNLTRNAAPDDTLFAFNLQRSVWFDDPVETINILERFPENSYSQLLPWASTIANIYAFSLEDFEKALKWADLAFYTDPQSKLNWILATEDFELFRREYLQTLEKYPQNNELRTFIGSQLFYQSFNEEIDEDRQESLLMESLQVLYPLYVNSIPFEIAEPLRSQFVFRPQSERLNLYQEFPSLFTQPMVQQLDEELFELHNIGLEPFSQYSWDNFDNTEIFYGLRSVWGNPGQHSHTLVVGDTYLSSIRDQETFTDHLLQLNYSYTHLFPERGWQLQGGGGAWTKSPNEDPEAQVFPYATVSSSYSDTSSFTSIGFTYRPVTRNLAIQQNIRVLDSRFYRQDNWFSEWLQSTVSGGVQFYSDSNQAFNISAGLRLLPLQWKRLRLNPLIRHTFEDAVRQNEGATPYYTPNNRQRSGGGIALVYGEPESRFQSSIEFVAQHEYGEGRDYRTQLTVDYNFNRYLDLQMEASYSTSDVWRENMAGATLRLKIPTSNNSSLDSYKTRRNSIEAPTQSSNATITGDFVGDRYLTSPQSGESSEKIAYSLVGQISRAENTPFISLYNWPVQIEGLNSNVIRKSRTYYNGGFFFDDLPHDIYHVSIDSSFSNSEYQIDSSTREWSPVLANYSQIPVAPDTLEFTILYDDPENATGAVAGAQTSPEEELEEPVRYSVAFNRTAELSKAIYLLNQYQQRFNIPINLYWNSELNLIQIASQPFSLRAGAEQLFRIIKAQMDDADLLFLSRIREGETEELTYRFQFGSFKDHRNALSFANQIRGRVDGVEVEVQTDPVVGIYRVVTPERNDWLESKQMLEQLRNQTSLEDVFRIPQPSISARQAEN